MFDYLPVADLSVSLLEQSGDGSFMDKKEIYIGSGFIRDREIMKLTIKAKSSSGEPYNVDFLVQNGRLSVHCNCKAGTFGQLCKHKTELIAGDESRLFDVSEEQKLTKLTSIISKAPEVQSIAGIIADSEKVIRREQAKLKTLKKQFATRLQEGITIPEDAE